MKFKWIKLSLLFALHNSICAQVELSFEKALALTLENNYDILMAQVNEEIASNNASMANNGFLPTVTANGAYNWNFVTGENKLRTETISFDPNNSYNYNASATVNYTLFDGQGRKYRYLQAKSSLRLSELQLQQTIQNTIVELSRIYFEVARLEESVANLQKSVDISKERYKRAGDSYDYGQANKLDVLNAKVDLNTDSINLITGIQELANLKRTLNLIMGQDISTDMIVNKEIEIQQNFIETDVVLAAEQNNLDLKLAKKNQALSEHTIGVSNSNWLPSVGANVGYLYRGTDDPNGAFLIGSNNFGPQAGLSLNWTLFNGANSAQLKNAKLGLKNSQLKQEYLEQSIKSQALNTYASFRNLLFILSTQEDNLVTAKDNFKRSESSYGLGQISAVEYRQAQLNLLNAEQALSRARYDAKNAEIQVLAIMGSLVE